MGEAQHVLSADVKAIVKENKGAALGLSLSFVVLFILSCQIPFFWDTITQSSKWAHWYYEGSFQQLLLPPELDAGHPPFFAIYLALLWTLFGKSLWISHLAVLPFTIGIVWQIARLARTFFPKSRHFWILLFVLSDATFLAQSTLVSSDLVLTFGLLLALNGVLEQKRGHIIFGSLLTGLVSIRGIFAIAALFLFIISRFYFNSSKTNRGAFKPDLLSLLPTALVLLLYYGWHYSQTDWLISTPEEAWSGHRTFVSLPEVFRNAGILGWRLLDFGRIGIWLALLAGLVGVNFKTLLHDEKIRDLVLFILSFLIAFAPAFLLISNPIAHRYLMPLYFIIALLAAYLLNAKYGHHRLLKWGMLLVILIQVSGHTWVYPRKIAQGWDASYAYLPYFKLREQMIQYIDSQAIPWEEVGTEFPNIGPMKYIDLNDEEAGFVAKDLDQQSYILYSNVFNDFSDEELDRLEKEWRVEQRFDKKGIEMVLYRKESSEQK